MNQQHRDIITAIGRKQPISTADIAEYLMDHFGYGGGMEFDAFRDQVSKTIGYLKGKGEIVGEDIPQSKGKPLRYWALANPQSDCQSADMASDVAEVEATHKESLSTVQENLTVAETPETYMDTWTTPIDSVEFKAAVKLTPMSVWQAMTEYYSCGYEKEDLQAFLAGIEFAEKHHGISQ